MLRVRTLVMSAATLTLLASVAFAGPRGSNMFSLQLSNGTADLYSPSQGANYISAYDHSEVGVQAEAWHYMTDEYATSVAFGVSMFSETDKPGASPAGDPDFKYTQNSFNVRIGGDRVVQLNDRSLIYFGPGIEYWSGKAKFDTGTASTTIETENVTRISLSSRIGATMKLGKSVGIGCHLGRRLGMASATDKGRKATWWPSSFDGAGGIVFGFGS